MKTVKFAIKVLLAAAVFSVFVLCTSASNAFADIEGHGPPFWASVTPRLIYEGIPTEVQIEFHVSYPISPTDIAISVGNESLITDPAAQIVADPPTSGVISQAECDEHTCRWIWHIQDQGCFNLRVKATPRSAGTFEIGQMKVGELTFPATVYVSEIATKAFLPYIMR